MLMKLRYPYLEDTISFLLYLHYQRNIKKKGQTIHTAFTAAEH